MEQTVRRGDLTPAERRGIVGALLEASSERKLKRGSIAKVAEQFKCSTKTVGRLWRAAVDGLEKENVLPDVGVNERERCGR